MNGLIRWDPFKDLDSMHRQLDDMFSGFWGGEWPGSLANMPVMDVYTEDDKQLVTEVHLPGFGKDEVDVNVHEGVLEIKGEKQEKEEKKDKKRSYMMRQSSTSFFRRVALPKVADEAKVKAEFKDGVLKIIVPFKKLPAPKKVAISETK